MEYIFSLNHWNRVKELEQQGDMQQKMSKRHVAREKCANFYSADLNYKQILQIIINC